MQGGPVFCEVRYRLDPDRLAEFEEYGRAWIRLIERFGGVYHGFFMPRATPGDTSISFPGKGRQGADDVAVALYGFPDGAAVIARFADPPFRSYERIFLRPVE